MFFDQNVGLCTEVDPRFWSRSRIGNGILTLIEQLNCCPTATSLWVFVRQLHNINAFVVLYRGAWAPGPPDFRNWCVCVDSVFRLIESSPVWDGIKTTRGICFHKDDLFL